MANTDLEKVLKKKVKPIVDAAMHKYLGITIDELSDDITKKLETPLIAFDVDVNIKFKKAKKLFKEYYMENILKKRYGNISEAARILDVDRRSIHRIVNKARINVKKIRKNMPRPYMVKQKEVNTIIEGVLDDYKEIIHPEKLEQMYKRVSSLSDDILKEIPEQPLTLKEAEEEFEKLYLLAALKQSHFNVAITAKKIGLRYETLHRKAKRLGLI